MPIVKNKSTEQNRRFWSHVETVARETDAMVCRETPQFHLDSPRSEQQGVEAVSHPDENNVRQGTNSTRR